MRTKILLTILLAAGISGIPARSSADDLFGEFQRLPDAVERGFSMGADFGFLVITGGKAAVGGVTNPGFQLAFTTGYDFTDLLTIEGVYTLGISEASPFDPVLQGGVNSFQFNLAGKAAYPLGRIYPFVEIGPGIWYSRPAYSPTAENKKLNILIGGGLEYYTMLRHYSLYLKATYFWINLPIDAITFAGGLKYTF
ncbi:MAG: adventurous gliding motility protein CglE [Pseudomonadota bacterium]